MKLLRLLMCCCFLFAGCHSAVPVETESVPGDISDFDFSLPENYTFEESEANSLHILKNGTVIGGLVLTGLKTSCLKDTGDVNVHNYVNSYGPVPMICEYIIMQGEDFLSVSLAVTDPDTNIRTESFHHLFARESRCFDLWFDRALSTDEDHDAILQKMLETELCCAPGG